jgi:hypothetical protein
MFGLGCSRYFSSRLQKVSEEQGTKHASAAWTVEFREVYLSMQKFRAGVNLKNFSLMKGENSPEILTKAMKMLLQWNAVRTEESRKR